MNPEYSKLIRDVQLSSSSVTGLKFKSRKMIECTTDVNPYILSDVTFTCDNTLHKCDGLWSTMVGYM